MSTPAEITKAPIVTNSSSGSEHRTDRAFLVRCLVFAGVLSLCFWRPLFDLVKYAFNNELHSHAILVPFISAYLIWLKRDMLSPSPLSEGKVRISGRLSFPAVILFSVGLVALTLRFTPAIRSAAPVDKLAVAVFAFVSLLVAGIFQLAGAGLSRKLAFPLLFLYWIVPFPNTLIDAIETFFQTTSAYAAHALFSLAGMPVIQDGMLFQLPGLTIRVAQECSGIRSSLVLFMTALLAGYMFLQSPWKRGLLAFVVIPLGILRNGFRIFTIATLTIEVNPGIIHSPLHHRGGPIFFAISLIPFFIVLLLLRRSEKSLSSGRGLGGGVPSDV